MSKSLTKNKHIGTNFDDFLKECGILEEVTNSAFKKILEYKMGRDFKPLTLNPVIIYDKDYKATHVSLTMDEFISIMKRIDQYVERVGKSKEKAKKQKELK